MQHRIVLFGEAEKGMFKVPYIVREMPQLIDHLGNPPQESEGLFFAIQALLYKREILYFRVPEEGFSKTDYFSGLKYLSEKENVKQITALCLPKVGDPEILEATQGVCSLYNSLLITTQKDLYDFLTG